MPTRTAVKTTTEPERQPTLLLNLNRPNAITIPERLYPLAVTPPGSLHKRPALLPTKFMQPVGDGSGGCDKLDYDRLAKEMVEIMGSTIFLTYYRAFYTVWLCAMLICVANFAQAAGATGDQTTSEAKLKRVALACTGDYPRFCPASETGRVNGRDQFICLKYFKTDVSLNCRRALTAAK